MKWIIPAILVLVVPTAANAQNIGVGIAAEDIRQSSTAGESYLRGWAAWLRGAANWLESKGVYENLHEEARSKYIDNWEKGVRTRWRVRDDATARRKATFESKYGIAARHRRLDKLEAAHELKQREEALRAKGILPPKPKSGFYHKGVRYDSYAAFKGTRAWMEMKVEAELRQLQRDLEKKRAEERRQAAVEFERNRRRYSASTVFWMDRRARNQAEVRRIMGEGWWLKYVEHPEKYHEGFKEALKRPLPVPYKTYEVKPFKRR